MNVLDSIRWHGVTPYVVHANNHLEMFADDIKIYEVSGEEDHCCSSVGNRHDCRLVGEMEPPSTRRKFLCVSPWAVDQQKGLSP